MLTVTVAGLGIALMPDFLASDGFRKGELVPLMPEEWGRGEFHLVWVGRRYTSPKLRAFITFATQRLFTGTTP